MEVQADLPKIYAFPGKAKSWVWAYFGFYKDEKEKTLVKAKAICKICRNAYKYFGKCF